MLDLYTLLIVFNGIREMLPDIILTFRWRVKRALGIQ